MPISPPPLQDVTILLVEDEIEAREMLSRMLTMNYQGLKIHLAEDGVSGLALFDRIRPEVVITDINMPQMNGITMAREIKQLDPGATIVAVTAHSETSYLLSAIEIGMDHYVMKPVNYPELFRVLDRIGEKIMLKRLVAEQVERIRRREQQLSQAERITHLGSWEWDVDTGEAVWSDELYRILGLEPESVTASFAALVDLVHPLDRETLEKAVQQVRETGQGMGVHYYRLLRPDGSSRIVRGQLEAVRDGAGRLSLIGACHDVTELKWAETALRASERRFSKIFQATPDLLSIESQKDGTLLEVNEAFLRALGLEREEVIGSSSDALGLWVDAEQPQVLRRSLQEKGEVRDLEVRLRARDGRELEGLVSADIIEINGNPFMLTLFKDISERKRLEEIIRHQAQHDTLTDLPNRKLFGDFLALELAQARRNRKSLAVLFMDLDHFKKINDTLGHASGDLLLQAVAQRLKRCVRESDTVARISGDEFNVLMPDLGQTDDVGTVVGKIMGVFETPFALEGSEVEVTTSVGISMFPDDGDSCEELLKKADGAMYVAKQSMGNSYQFYNAEINTRTVNRQSMERRLRQAVSKGELELLYQPLLDLETGRIVAGEALLRWHHPERGMLLPAQFMGVAEETGAIVPIGEWVIFQACSQMRKWREKGFDLSVSVNLSNREFSQPNFIDLAMRALSDTGLDPGLLELDITEKSIMNNPAFSIRNMRRLTDIGVGFSVDDFGVGASSLQRIKELPIGKLKIARSFIRDILTEQNDLDVVSAVICMSHSLKMRVNAVGVESREQLELIGSYGCDEVQGDLISRPLPAPEFERLLAQGGTHA